MRIALDAMGGDYAPKSTIEGAVLALKEYTYIEKLFLVGDAVSTGRLSSENIWEQQWIEGHVGFVEIIFIIFRLFHCYPAVLLGSFH